MACNDCQPRPSHGSAGTGAKFLGLRPGTSPEEIALAEHLEEALGLVISTNPLQPGSEPPSALPPPSAASGRGATIDVEHVHVWPLVLQDKASGIEVLRILVLSRGGFDPATGCREARICIQDLRGEAAKHGDIPEDMWVVRQGGADMMAQLAGKSAREEELAREDQDRALGWSVARLGADGFRVGAWRYVLRASFANPPRSASAPTVAHCQGSGLAVRMLTGDACIAALYIARQIGIVVEAQDQDLLLHEPDEPPVLFAGRVAARLQVLDATSGTDCHNALGRLCVVVPGEIVRRLVEVGGSADEWLADERISAVIYRTRAADKALIVGRTEELGRALQRRRASVEVGGMRQLKCMARKHGEEGVCLMLGDAANDAEAISLDGVVGISLRHGATPCKLGADFIVDGPGALVALRTELYGRALAGSQWLLEDVCLLCGLVSALTLCGVWAASFTFLPRGFLYDDPFDARIMTLFSGGVYPLSACAAACSVAASSSATTDGSRRQESRQASKAMPVRFLLLGTALGCLLGLAGPSDDTGRFGRHILTSTFCVCLVRHTFAHLLSNLLQCPRPANGKLGVCACLRLRVLAALLGAGSGAEAARAAASKLLKPKAAASGALAASRRLLGRSMESPSGSSSSASESCAARALMTGSRPLVRLAFLTLLLLVAWLV